MAKAFPLGVIGALSLAGCAGAETGPDVEEGIENVGEAEQDLTAYCDDVLTWNAPWTDFENQVLTLVNQKRAAGATCGGVYYAPRPALTYDERLRCSARKHSKDMGANNYFSHTGLDGSQPWDRMTSAGYTWTYAAENIAAGYPTPSAVVQGWMASSGHCRNIMSATAKNFGAGYYYGGTSTYKHYWTQNFGRQ
jgi:uncharacterized protein YkwD